ncbi:MAG: fumarylacetoacetate hydrolase family protein [Bacteriovoracaceae bacterium]|nr:fumarylacetoacetate hydrolase family protein [Candidatus Brocadiales bacterium]MBL6992041.1 fumarylacetoacetate hydrolase family protein [Bacteriovoracaceae bacterium]
MKFINYVAKGNARLGVFLEDKQKILDINTANKELPTDIISLIEGGFLPLVCETIKNGLDEQTLISPDDVLVAAAVPNPRLIVCVGQNYKDHADEQGAKYPKNPLLFNKSPWSVCGPYDPIIYPDNVEKLDYEVELGIVINKKTKDVSASNAIDHIFGYCTFHDVSARCAQFGDRQWFRGKSFDTFAPIGPYLVTKDEIPCPNNLKLWCKVNGETRQQSNTSNLIFNVETLVEYISHSMTLMPGDIIATGTPGGVGVFMNPPRLLNRGDTVELEVEPLGKIINKVI